jgi:DNA-binding XRE family transcriptional regulator
VSRRLECYRTLLGEALARARLGASCPEAEAARAIGVNLESVVALEAGRYQMTLERVIALCRLYEVDPVGLLIATAQATLGTAVAPDRFDALALFNGVAPDGWTVRPLSPDEVPPFDPAEVRAVKGLKHNHPRRKQCVRALRGEYEAGASIRDLLAVTDVAFSTMRLMLLEAGCELRPPTGASKDL